MKISKVEVKHQVGEYKVIARVEGIFTLEEAQAMTAQLTATLENPAIVHQSACESELNVEYPNAKP